MLFTSNNKHGIALKPAIILSLALFLIASITSCDNRHTPVSMPDEIIPLSDDIILQTINTANGYLLVHFTSYDPNCSYCVSSNPYIDNLAREYIVTLKVARISWEPWTDYANHSANIKKQFGIRGIPMFVLYKDGKEIWQGYGYTDDTLSLLKTQLQQCCRY